MENAKTVPLFREIALDILRCATLCAVPNMPNDAFSQLALAADPKFLTRLKAACLAVAEQVMVENAATPNHAARLALAVTVLKTPTRSADFAQLMVMRPNVLGFATSYSFMDAAVLTASGDADLQSQFATDWDTLTAL